MAETIPSAEQVYERIRRELELADRLNPLEGGNETQGLLIEELIDDDDA